MTRTRCGNCNTLSVQKKIITYSAFVKDVGVTVRMFPMLVCDNCNSQWISGEGDDLIENEAEKIRKMNYEN